MPKPGYTRIIVRTDIRDHLKKIAEAQGYRSINQLLEAWIRVHPGVHPTLRNGGYPRPETNAVLNAFPKKTFKNLWCGGWDLNPRRPTPEDLKSSPLSWGLAPPFTPFRPGSGTPAHHLSWIIV